MAKLRILYWIVLMLIYLSGCTSFRQVPIKTESESDETTARSNGKINEDFDPFSLRNEEMDVKNIKQHKAKVENNSALIEAESQKSKFEESESQFIEKSVLVDSIETDFGVQEMVWGWRVQICALSDAKGARSVQRDALLNFDEQVYLTYDSPYYKVRIGDCQSRYEADDLQRKAIERGFDDAWVVRTKVSKPAKAWEDEAVPEN